MSMLSLKNSKSIIKLKPRTILLAFNQNYAEAPKKVVVASGSIGKKNELQVETDVYRLTNYACGTNIYKDGEDAKLKPKSEYPDWLWTLRKEETKLEDLDPNTKEYWIKVLILTAQKQRIMAKLKPKKYM